MNKRKTIKLLYGFLQNFFKVKRMFANFHIRLETSKIFTTKQRNKQANMTFLQFQENNTSNLQLTVSYLIFFIKSMKRGSLHFEKARSKFIDSYCKKKKKRSEKIWSKGWNTLLIVPTVDKIEEHTTGD